MFDLKNIQPSVRRLKEMANLVFDRDWLKTASPETELYFVWRNVAQNDKEREKIAQAGLRYDITEFAPLTLGQEYNKTFGHTHSLVPGTDQAYTEIYEVLEGKVCFLFQKFSGAKIEDIFAVFCSAGDKYIIPPGYAHISINPTRGKTVLANWLAIVSQQSYQEIEKMKGAGYYALVPSGLKPWQDKPEREIGWVKNENYAVVPELRFVQPNNLSQFSIDQSQPMYNLVNQLEKLDFLKNPQKYDWE